MMTENEIGRQLVDAAVRIHRELGPGLMETVYEVVLAHELRSRGLKTERQVPIGFTYKSIEFDGGFRTDLIVEKRVIVELKCIEGLASSHKKQLLAYLRPTDKRPGYLLNFAEAFMKHGIIRIVNRLPEPPD